MAAGWIPKDQVSLTNIDHRSRGTCFSFPEGTAVMIHLASEAEEPGELPAYVEIRMSLSSTGETFDCGACVRDGAKRKEL